jgi:hypothetical protein
LTELEVRPLQPVVVDDQLALLFALGGLDIDPGTQMVTTYSWQQRALGAFVAPRATAGQLQRLAGSVGATAATALAAVGQPNPDRLLITDPRTTAVDIARLRVAGANPLAAETIAAARHLGAVVRFSPGNGRGHVVDHVLTAGVDFEIWDIAGSDHL